MTSPQTSPELPTDVAQPYVNEYGRVFTAAAQRIDEGTFSWDDRVKLLHRLIELQIFGTVAVTQAAIKGPWTAKIRDVPRPSIEIELTPNAQHERQLSVAPGGSFTTDPPAIVVPDHLIDFLPEIIRTNQKFFRIGLRDPHFSARIYTGTVRIRNITTGAIEDKQVTVGL